MARAIIQLTTAVSGSGKTYLRCARFLVDDFLMNSDTSVHYSNFPVFPAVVAEYVAKRKGCPVEDIQNRIKVIPQAEIEKWRLGKSGPWEYFEGIDLNDAHVAIDEIHNFCGSAMSTKIRQRWQAWVGEVRHRGATIEFITQSPRKVAKELLAEAGVRYQLVSSEDRRDPICGILLGDWYELRAGWLTREYYQRVWVLEKREVDGYWVTESKQTFTLDPFYFQFYDSYSAPHSGGNKGEAAKREFQKRGRLSLLFWFVRRNFFRLFLRMLGAIFFFFIMFGGGRLLFTWFIAFFVGVPMAGNTSPAHPIPEKIPPAVVSTVPAPVHRTVSVPATMPSVPVVLYQEVQSERDQLQAKLAEVEQQKQSDARVCLIGPSWVVFRDGSQYAVGETIPYGLFAGSAIRQIDHTKGFVLLSDGRILRLGGGVFGGNTASQTDQQTGRLQPGVSGTTGIDSLQPPATQPGTAYHGSGRVDAVGVVPSRAVIPKRPVGDRGTISR